MKKFILAVGLLSLAGTAFADGGKSCEELKAEIAAKLDAKGISGYSLEIVDKGSKADGKVVGTCEKGSKEIIYKR
ncbi:DUF1161 domain-containing protein [Pseudomonas sp. NPDC087336]|jgi:hypothetical protein|uniref:DUF1161 domain-containing protein n=1 Tax=Pseudomonas sp. NPDC087336 TaxID=3364436 RepID=UPI00380C7828